MGQVLIGRDVQVSTVRLLLESEARAAQLVGGPGVGKSAVISAVATEVEAAGWQCIPLRGRPAEHALPFAGLVELMAGRGLRLDHHARAGAEAIRYHVIAPSVSGGAGAIMGEGSGGPALELRLSVLGWLEGLARERPLLVTLDDQQWLDDSSWSILAFAANRLRGGGVSFLVSTRSQAGAQGLEAPVVALDALTFEESSELVDRLELPLDAAARSAVLDRAAGNPLALREFAHAAHSTSARGETSSNEFLLPPRVEAAFAAELPRLPPGTRAALLLAAAGTGDLQTLGRAAPTIAADLEPAERVGLVTVVDGQVQFRHPLVRSTVYDGAPTVDRMAVHAALAEACVGDDDRRAWHRAKACPGVDETLAEELVAAADRAQSRGAHSEAGRALMRAAELSADPVDRDRRLLEALSCTAATGHIARLQALSERLRQQSDDPVVRATATQRVGYAMAQSMRQAAAMDTLEGVLGDLLALNPDAGWASLTTMASLSYQTGRGSGRVRSWYDRYRREAPPTPAPMHPMTEAVRTWVETALSPLSHPPERVEVVTRTPPMDDRLPPALVAAQEMLLGAAAWLLDETETAGDRLEKAAGIMRRTSSFAEQIQTLMALGQVHMDQGRFAEAATSARVLIDLAEANHLVYYRLAGLELLARVEAITGSAVSALEQADSVLAGVRPGECSSLEVNVRMTQARAAFLADDLDGAYRYARSIFDGRGQPTHPHVCYRSLAEVVSLSVRTGQHDEAKLLVLGARSHLEGTRNPRYSAVLRRAAALLADGDEAEALFELAVGEPGASRWPFELAQARADYGGWLRRQRRPSEARIQLELARESLLRMGARPWASLVDEELRAAGVSRVDATADTWSRLTPQERQIVHLAAAGLTNREIGTRLFLSPRTVSTHLYHAFPKLGVASRAELRDVVDDDDDARSHE